MKKQSALLLALCLFALVLAMCLYSAPRLAQEATAYAQAAPVVVIDAGHGGEDGGASSPDGVLESGLNLQFALRMRDLLQFARRRTGAASWPRRCRLHCARALTRTITGRRSRHRACI